MSDQTAEMTLPTEEELTSEIVDKLHGMEAEERDALVAIINKPEEKRNEAEQEHLDTFTGEVLETIIGSEQLTPEQRRALVNELNMQDTRFNGTVVNSLKAAASSVAGNDQGADITEMVDVPDVQGMQLQTPPGLPAQAPSQDRGKGGRTQ